jgi:hypothetical protein
LPIKFTSAYTRTFEPRKAVPKISTQLSGASGVGIL